MTSWVMKIDNARMLTKQNVDKTQPHLFVRMYMVYGYTISVYLIAKG